MFEIQLMFFFFFFRLNVFFFRLDKIKFQERVKNYIIMCNICISSTFLNKNI